MNDSVVPPELLCPICYEIPLKEIYQCINGHIVCNTCVENLSECPQCRVRFERNKIRNRVMESLLESMKFDCSNKSLGCTAKIAKKDMAAHLETCSFRSINIPLCASLGYSCGFRFNPKMLQDGLKHLQDAHGIIVSHETDTTISICLEGIMEISLNRKSLWTPVILNFEGSSLLLLAMFNEKDKTISLICIQLNEDIPAAAGKILITFRVKSTEPKEIPDLMFTTAAIGVEQAISAIKYPQFSFKLDYLIHGFVVDGALVAKCSVGRESTLNQVEEEFTFILLNSSFEVSQESVASSSASSTSSSSSAPPERARTVHTNRASVEIMHGNISLLESTSGASGPIQGDEPRRMAWIARENVVSMNYAVKASQGIEAEFVVRAPHQGGKIPGRLQLGESSCCIPYDGREIRKEHYEILTGPRNAYRWVTTTRDIHPDAIPGGKDPNGEIYFIGRTPNIQGKMLCGKVHVSHGSCYIAFDGREHAYRNYELLILTTEGKRLNNDL